MLHPSRDSPQHLQTEARAAAILPQWGLKEVPGKIPLHKCDELNIKLLTWVSVLPPFCALQALTVCHLCTTGSQQRGQQRLHTAGFPSGPGAPQCSLHLRCTEGLWGEGKPGVSTQQPWGFLPLPSPCSSRSPFSPCPCEGAKIISEPTLSSCHSGAAVVGFSGSWGFSPPNSWVPHVQRME